MKVIYEPKGAAREYAPLALNLYTGCTGGCRYCYAPGDMRMSRDEFYREARPRTMFDHLDRDAYPLSAERDTRRILMCFTCDPFAVDDGAAKAALETLRNWNRPVSVLTKRGDEERVWPSLEIMAEMDSEIGISLVWTDDQKRIEWEPGTASIESRLALLRRAKSMGIKTWASVEPVIDPWEALGAIESLIPLCDRIMVGKLNHMAPPVPMDWRGFRRQADALLSGSGVKYRFKQGLVECTTKPI